MAKFERNQERDRRVVRDLKQLGYVVVVVWECEAVRQRALARRLIALTGDLVAARTASA